MYLKLQSHLKTAGCFYHHLIVRLEREFSVDLKGVVLFSRSNQSSSQVQDYVQEDDEIREWALSACHRCFVYLGDLARYQLEFEGGTTQVAKGYYKQAICLEPSVGLPHNQLALLSGNANQETDAAFHYLMCLASRVPFAGADHNLKRLFERNSNRLKHLDQEYCGEAKETDIHGVVLRKFLVRFLDLQRKLLPPCRTSQEELSAQCENILHDFIESLAFKLHQMDYSNSETRDENADTCLSGGLMLKIVALSMLASHKLRLQGSASTPAATSFALSLYSQLLQHCTQSINSWKILFQQGHAPHNATSLPCEDDFRRNNKSKQNVSLEDKCDSEETAGKEEPSKRARPVGRRRRRVVGESDSDEEVEEADNIEELSEDDLSEGGGDFDSDGLSPELSDISDGEESSSTPKDALGKCEEQKTSFKRPLAIRFPGMPSLQVSCEESESNVQRTVNKRETVDEANCQGIGDLGAKGSIIEESNSEPELELSTAAFLRWLCSHPFLPSIKIIFDWLRIHPAIAASCTQTLSSFWSRTAELLNSLPPEECLRLAGMTGFGNRSEWKQVDLLPEDYELLGFSPLSRALDLLQLNRDKNFNTDGWMGLIRLQCLLSFGTFIADSKTVNVLHYNESSCQYIGPSQRAEQEAAVAAEISRKKEEKDKLQREKLMKALAEQKLKSDVASMEQSLTQAVVSASPILVVDAQCLCTHLHFIRQFVASEKFIVVIPFHVIEALDELKKGKENHTARDAIKFLEQQLKTGNRWIRAQQAQETVDGKADNIPPRYKKKDIAAWRFTRVVDCAHYFSQQAGGNMVTLLYSASHTAVVPPPQTVTSQEGLMPNTGTRPSETALAIANKHGVVVEEVKKFHAKWVAKKRN
ncbi:nonsense-mediated mRNA decay factor SMG5-like isoform X2 [Corticium candelabrum]|nr:nonsense-mediated mRNA decay factor SMG5-like isoform X2 [Corticium candelabrum]